jgi:hypothetical protein
MKEVLSFFTFGIGALCFVAFFATLKPLTVVHLDRSARQLAQPR